MVPVPTDLGSAVFVSDFLIPFLYNIEQGLRKIHHFLLSRDEILLKKMPLILKIMFGNFKKSMKVSHVTNTAASGTLCKLIPCCLTFLGTLLLLV